VVVHGPKGCYVTVDPSARETISLRATGFTPLSAVDLLFDGERVTSFDANPAGVVKIAEQAPYRASGEGPLAITLRESLNPANATTTATRVTALRFTVARPPKTRRNHTYDLLQRVRFRGRGFTQAKPVWGHYVHDGRVRKTVRIARGPTGPCGTFSVRLPTLPIPKPAEGRWTLQADQQRRYSKRPHSVFVPLPICVTSSAKICRP
jgi:hypothetical protein